MRDMFAGRRGYPNKIPMVYYPFTHRGDMYTHKGRPWYSLHSMPKPVSGRIEYKKNLAPRKRTTHHLSYTNPKVFTAWKRAIHGSRHLRRTGFRYLKK